MSMIHRSNNPLLSVLFLQLIIYATVFFNVPVARQVIGFIYFSFVPGFLIVNLIKNDESDELETFLLSVGTSIAFLMFSGLLINGLGTILGVSKPLSLIPLIIILNVFITINMILVYLRKGDVKLSIKTFGNPVFVLPLVVLPILSVVGAMWVNVFSNNIILLLMLIVISLLIIIAVFSERTLSMKTYPLVILVIAISLLFHSSLISNHIYIGDAHLEYFVSKTTQNNGYWKSTNPYGDTTYGRFNSILSVTILSTVYSKLLNIDLTWVFKIIFPLIFSLVPLTLYKVWKKYINEKSAFLSAFLLMANGIFYTEMLGVNRQIIAELFFALLLLVILTDSMRKFSKMIFFIIFSLGLVTSHYGLSAIFLFFISLTFILLKVFKHPSKKVTASMVMLFSVIMFAWYIYTSNSAVFESFLSFGDYVYKQLGEFFNLSSREPEVLRGLGLESPPTIWNVLSRAFAYATQFLIVVGFIGLITKRSEIHFGDEYFTLGLVAMVFLAALVAVPGLASTMNMTRFYHVLLFLLAPFCGIGAKTVVTLVCKQRTEMYSLIILLVVLIPYFLFQTGFVYEITGVQNWSVPLSKHRMNHIILMRTFAYVNDWKAAAASWLRKNINVQVVNVYADVSAHELDSYGMMQQTRRMMLSNTTTKSPYGIMYLSYLNVVDGRVITYNYIFNTTELSYLNDTNVIYSNGGSKIYAFTK